MTNTTPPLSLDTLSLNADPANSGAQSSPLAAATVDSPVLDHHMFPHIIDKIIDAAPYESLLVLRSTSWNFCNRVDWQLTRHLVIEYVRLEPSGWILEMRTPDKRRLPFLHQFYAGRPLSPEAISRMRTCLRHTLVVETCDELLTDRLPVAGAFTGVHILKLYPDPIGGYNTVGYDAVRQWFPQVDTLVDFVPFYCYRGNRLEYITSVDSDFPSFPDHVERVTITVAMPIDLSYYPDDISMDFSRIGDYPKSLREAVFIFQITQAETADSDDRIMTCEDKDVAYGLDAIVDFNQLGLVQYTLVDLCNVYPKYFGLPQDTAPAQMEEMVHAQVWRRLHNMQDANGWSDEKVARKGAAFETISRSAYEARVGNDEQFNFETIFYLKPPPGTVIGMVTGIWADRLDTWPTPYLRNLIRRHSICSL